MNKALEALQRRKELLGIVAPAAAPEPLAIDRNANLERFIKAGPREDAAPPPAEFFSAPASAADKLARFTQIKAEAGDPDGFSEVRRICRLPLVPELTREELDEFCRANVLADQYDRGWRLFNVQAAAVMAYDDCDGLFAPIGVGWGKTLITIMVAERAFRAGIRRSLLLVPSQVYLQLVRIDLAWARRHVPLTVPFIPMGGKSMDERRAFARSGKVGCYILPYSCLSTRDTSDLLEAIKPGLVICDEAHALKNRRSARTKRVVDFVVEHRPKFVALSGTITNKSVRDYHHLMKAALGDGSPLPLSTVMAEEWGAVVDAQADASTAQTGPLLPLVEWAMRNFPQERITLDRAGFRRAYRLRLNSAPGVVSTGDSEIGTSLLISNQPVEGHEKTPEFAKLKELIAGVEERWVTPSGDEIEHAIHTWKWLYELNAGFYNDLRWPTPEDLASRRSCTVASAREQLDRAFEHHAATQDFARELRGWLEHYARPGLDTPMLVGRDMAQHADRNVSADLFQKWTAMRALDFEQRPERDSKAVRVCDFKIRHALKFALGVLKDAPGKGALIWYYHQEVGAWISEALRLAGIDALHCPAGEAHNRSILEESARSRIVVASMTAHGTGKNLQHFQHTYFAQWPRSSTTAEQVLGRNHRHGQEADELVYITNNTSEFDNLNMAACLQDALYIAQTTGTRQKVIYGGYDPLPKIFPEDVLVERGFQVSRLTPDQRRMLVERFTATDR